MIINEPAPIMMEYHIIVTSNYHELSSDINIYLKKGFELLSPLKFFTEFPIYVQEMGKVDRKLHFPANDVNQRDWGKVE